MRIIDWYVLLYLITKHSSNIKDTEQVSKIKKFIEEQIEKLI